MDICMAAARRSGSRVDKQWWEQDVLDLKCMQTADWEAEWMEGEEGTDDIETG